MDLLKKFYRFLIGLSCLMLSPVPVLGTILVDQYIHPVSWNFVTIAVVSVYTVGFLFAAYLLLWPLHTGEDEREEEIRRVVEEYLRELERIRRSS